MKSRYSVERAEDRGLALPLLASEPAALTTA